MMKTVAQYALIDFQRTKALHPLREMLLNEPRFKDKPIEISKDGCVIKVTISNHNCRDHVCVTITKTYFEYENEKGIIFSSGINNYYETQRFEKWSDLKYKELPNSMLYFNNDQTEEIGDYILRIHDTLLMSKEELSKMVYLIDPTTANAYFVIECQGWHVLRLKNEELLKPAIDILQKEGYVLHYKRKIRIYELFNRLRGGIS